MDGRLITQLDELSKSGRLRIKQLVAQQVVGTPSGKRYMTLDHRPPSEIRAAGRYRRGPVPPFFGRIFRWSALPEKYRNFSTTRQREPLSIRRCRDATSRQASWYSPNEPCGLPEVHTRGIGGSDRGNCAGCCRIPHLELVGESAVFQWVGWRRGCL